MINKFENKYCNGVSLAILAILRQRRFSSLFFFKFDTGQIVGKIRGIIFSWGLKWIELKLTQFISFDFCTNFKRLVT